MSNSNFVLLLMISLFSSFNCSFCSLKSTNLSFNLRTASLYSYGNKLSLLGMSLAEVQSSERSGNVYDFILIKKSAVNMYISRNQPKRGQRRRTKIVILMGECNIIPFSLLYVDSDYFQCFCPSTLQMN